MPAGGRCVRAEQCMPGLVCHHPTGMCTADLTSFEGGVVPSDDAGTPIDAGPAVDAAGQDAGPSPQDAGPPSDAGPGMDGGFDGGFDAGPGPVDAGTDSGPPPTDAGSDAGPPDAGVDSGPPDAGAPAVDAGP